MVYNELNSTKVVISVSPWGPKLTRKAAEILKCRKLYQEISGGKKNFGGYFPDAARYRTDHDLVAGLERLEGNYARLDRANNGCRLRIVRVPKHVSWVIECDPEYLTEYVAERRRSWHGDCTYMDIDAYRPKIEAAVRTIPAKNEPGVRRYLHGEIRMFCSGRYGVAAYYLKKERKWAFVKIEFGKYIDGAYWGISAPDSSFLDLGVTPVEIEDIVQMSDLLAAAREECSGPPGRNRGK